MMNKKIIVFASLVLIFLSFFTVKAQDSQKYGETDVHFNLKTGFIELGLQAYELFQNQLFWTEATIKTNQSFDSNIFNFTLELPTDFIIVSDNNYHPNSPINESTGYQWVTSWVVNSSTALPSVYKINITENLYYNKKTDGITINAGPTIPYKFNVETDKSSYSFGEIGNVFVHILDTNDYPFNIEGKCNSTIYYPNKTSTSFKNVLMTYVIGSKGEYIPSNIFQAWNVEGIYTVEVNCTKPYGHANNTFNVYTGITTTVPSTAGPSQPSGPSESPGPSQAQQPVRVVNFSTDTDFIKILLTPNKTGMKSIKVFNNGKTKLDLTGKIQYMSQLAFFKDKSAEYMFQLNPNETEDVEINFFAKNNQEAGVYPGKVVFTSEGIQRTVLIVVEVESEKPLFDLKIEVLPEYRRVYPGDKVMAQLTMYNLGKVGTADINLEYGIKDLNGRTIDSVNETIRVETQLSVNKSLIMLSTLKPDSYVFFGKVSYENVVGTGSDVFQVLERAKFTLPMNYAVLILTAIIILLLVLIMYVIKRKPKLEKIIPRKRKK